MNSSNGSTRSGASARTSSNSVERGYALVAVVAIVGILAVIAMALTERGRVGSSMASDFLEETRDLYAVQAGIAMAKRKLAEHPDLGKDGQMLLEFTWDERHLDILVTDQAKKIDINRASLQQLAEGFEATGFNTTNAAMLAARTIDWRDPDDRPQPNGAEAADYLAAGLLSPPRNERFVSMDEMGTLLGMTPDGGEKLRARFTIMRALIPIAPRPISTFGVAALDRKAPAPAPSDGLTRSADVTHGAWDLDVEVRVRRDGNKVERASAELLSE